LYTFSHYYIVGDLVLENDQIWKFLLNVIQIIDLLLLSTFDNQVLFKLQKCIEYYNLKYVELFNDNLKPKHHFLTHYCSIIKKSGPLKFIWSYNFESKHKQLKSYTKNTNSRINVPISLGIKCSIHFSEFLINFNINNFTNYKLINDGSPIITYEHFNQINVLCLNEYNHLLQNALCCNKLVYFNTKYSYNNVLITYESELTAYLLKKNYLFR